MLYFLKKARKIAATLGRWGLRPQIPVGLRWLGAPPPDPQVVTLTQLTCYFCALLRFLGIVKITTYDVISSYLSGS